MPATPGAILPPLPPPAGAAAAAAAPPISHVSPEPPSTFAKLYTTPVADVHVGVYGPILGVFMAEPATGQNMPAEIWTILDNAGEGFLQAYLLLGPDGQAMTIHTITHYPTLLGVVMPWDGLCFSFVGEVAGNMEQPVEFLAATAFNLIAAVCMPTVGMMEVQWIAVVGVQFIAPLDATDIDTEVICTCHAALLPFIAVHRCLAPMSMQQLWALLGQPLVDSSHM